MGPIAIIAGIGLAIGAVGTVMSIKAQQKQAQFQKQAQQAQRAQDNMKAARERREAIRTARIASGEVTQSAANQGVGTSSAALGGLGSIASQTNQQLSFLDGANKLADQASEALGRAAQYATKAETFGAIAGFGMKVFSSAGSLGGKG